ncbi:MAG: hypothetical protein K5765_06680 [Clostridia bacterium]|nr:hypothetical protein [Clostridia bacterium]
MKDLGREELKKLFKENILSSLKESEKRNFHDVKIIFKFSDNSEYQFEDEMIYTCYGNIYFHDVDLGSWKNNYAINIIINNLHYDCFSFIRKDFKLGKPERDHPSVDEYIFIYHRFEN